ncbi:MAG: YcxB family protein [Betaproteobacteria bacterium]|nr:YcxB family protein [Betaproteobacteria bacterium]
MITGSISTSDYLNAQRLHRAKSVRWFHITSGIIVAVGIATYFFGEHAIGFMIGGAGIGGVIGDLVLSSLYLPWKVRRIHQQHKDFASPFTYTWDSECIEVKHISGQAKRQWSDYAKCKEDEKQFLLYHSDIMFEMIPKSWFQDQTQIAEFRNLAHRARKT